MSLTPRKTSGSLTLPSIPNQYGSEAYGPLSARGTPRIPSFGSSDVPEVEPAAPGSRAARLGSGVSPRMNRLGAGGAGGLGLGGKGNKLSLDLGPLSNAMDPERPATSASGSTEWSGLLTPSNRPQRSVSIDLDASNPPSPVDEFDGEEDEDDAEAETAPLASEQPLTEEQARRVARAMDKIATRAMAANLVIRVSRNVVGTIQLESRPAPPAPPAPAAGEATVEEATATKPLSSSQPTAPKPVISKPAGSMVPRPKPVAAPPAAAPPAGAKGRQVSPLLILRRKEATDKARKKKEAKKRQRELFMAQEREKEAQECQAMLAEEWDMARLKWYPRKVRDGSWRSVRVFISSTFNDMHGERDALTRTVFPALNQRLRSRRVRAVPVDLRWGLTAEDTSDSGLGALEHCFLEIDHSRPFFLLLCGERYGWIPPNYRVSDRPEFDWVKDFPSGHSITAMEVVYGFLRKPYLPVHALLYERDPSFMSEISNPNERRIFAFDYADNEEILQRRNDLRADVRHHQFTKCRRYTCRYGGLDEEGKPHVTALQQFEASVLEDLWKAICFEFPPPPPPLSELEFERSFHTHFVEERSRQFVGRQETLTRLCEMVDKAVHDDSLPLVIIGQPGTGKTSLVTAFARMYADTRLNAFVLVHVVSASPTSTDIREVLIRLCKEMEERFDVLCDMDETDYQNIKEAFVRMLHIAGEVALKRNSHILLIIDAVNQLNPFYGAHTMDWLPTFMPPGVQAVLSTITDEPCLVALAKRDPSPIQFLIPPLSLREREQIVVQQLSEYRKKLTPGQLKLLLDKPESHKPLFLLTCCEELRLQAQYGNFGSGVDTKIRELPGSIPALLDVVLERVERDLTAWASASKMSLVMAPDVEHKEDAAAPSANRGDASPVPTASGVDELKEAEQLEAGAALVRNALTLLVCSRHGLRETELLSLLAPPGKSQLPTAIWARLYRSLELYLQPLGEEEQGMLGFFHQQMVFAVRKRYLQGNRFAEADVCARLASYFVKIADPTGDASWQGTSRRAFQDVVYYQLRALEFSGLVTTLGSLRFIQALAFQGAGSIEHLLRDYHDAQEELRTVKYSVLKDRLPSGTDSSRQAFLQWLSEFMVFVGSHHSSFVAHPQQLFQEAINQPGSWAPCSAARKLLQEQVDELKRQFDVHRQELKSNDLAANPPVVDLVPRRWLEWVNKPQRNRVVADHAGFNSEITACCLSVDGALTALGFKDGSVLLLDTTTGELVRECTVGGHHDSVTALQFSVDGQRLASGSHDSMVIVWETGTGANLSALDLHTRTVTSLAWLESITGAKKGKVGASNRVLATASLDRSIRLWEERTKATGRSRPGQSSTVTEARYEMIWCKEVLVSPFLALAYCDANHSLYAGRADGHIEWFDAHAPNLGLIDMSKLEAHRHSSVSSLRLSLDGTIMVSGGMDNLVKIWRSTDAGAWNCVNQHQSGHSGAVTCVDISADGSRIVSASLDKKMILWDVESRSEVLTLAGHADAIYNCWFLNSSRVVSASFDKTVKVWDVGGVENTRKAAQVKTAATAKAKAANKRPAIGSPAVRGRRNSAADRGRPSAAMVPMAPYGSHADRVNTIIVAPDCKRAVSGGADKEIKVWNLSDGEEIAVLIGHTAPVTAVHFTADGTLLLSADDMGTLIVWDYETFDYLCSTDAHGGPIKSIASLQLPAPVQIGSAPYSLLVLTGGHDGECKAWGAGPHSVVPWASQPPRHHNSGVISMRFIPAASESSSWVGPVNLDAAWGVKRPTVDVLTQPQAAAPPTRNQKGKLTGKPPAGAKAARARARSPAEEGGQHKQANQGFVLPGRPAPVAAFISVDSEGRMAVWDAMQMKLLRADNVPGDIAHGGANSFVSASVSPAGERVAFGAQLMALPVVVAQGDNLSTAVASTCVGSAKPARQSSTEKVRRLSSAEDSDAENDRTNKDAPPLTCSAVGFSHDGALLGVGTSDRMVSILDSAAPLRAPFAQFQAYGDVTAVAVGYTVAGRSGRDRTSEGIFSDDTGCIGVIVAGDSTGALAILRLVDVTQMVVATAAPLADEVQATGEVGAAGAETAPAGGTAAGGTSPRAQEDVADVIANVQDIELMPGTIAQMATLARALDSSIEEDVLAAEQALTSLGITLDSMAPTRLSPNNSKLLLEAAGLAPTYQVLGSPTASDAPSSDDALFTSPHMNNLVRSVFSRPRGVVCVFGGAGGLHDMLVPNLRSLISHGVMPTVVGTGSMLLDGGTQSGIMKMVGDAVKTFRRSCVRSLGVCPSGVVNVPGNQPIVGNADLQPQHSSFCLVPSNDWGGETSSMFSIVEALVRRVPAVAVLANGGQISKKEVLNAVRHDIPLVVIQGSGRLADQIAGAVLNKQEGVDYTSDQAVTEVIDDGTLRVFHITDTPQNLHRLLYQLLEDQREKMDAMHLGTEHDDALL